MAVIAIPIMQAQRPESFKMLRGGKAQVPATLVKSDSFGAKYKMTKGATSWDFEDQAQLNDWTFVDNDGDGFNWEYYNNAGLETGRMTCHSGEGVMSSKSYDNDNAGALTPDNWMISPVMELGGTLKFWAMGQDPSYASETFAVYVCVGDPSDVNNFVKVGVDHTATGEYVEYTFDLTPYQGQMGCFAIRHYNVTDMFMLNVDDVTLNTEDISVPDPTMPENVVAEPTATTAAVTWDDNDDNFWNLRYRVYNPKAAQSFFWGAEDDDYSEFTLIDADGDGMDWRTTGYEGAHGGDNVFWGISYYSGYGAFDPDNWMISPEVPLGGQLSFWAANSSSLYPDGITVYVTTGDADDLNSYVAISDYLVPSEDWENYTFDLSEYACRMGHFAIRHHDSYNNYYIFVDDIELTIPGEEDPNEWIYVYDLNETNYTIEGLVPETTYEVQVQAYNENEVETDWTPIVKFTTLAEGITPGPHGDGTWLVIYDKNGDEVFYNLNYEDCWDDEEAEYFCFNYNDDVCRLVPVDIATFGNYKENGYNVKFYVLKDGKRYGPSEDMQALNFGYAYGMDFESLMTNPLTEIDNCFTMPLGDYDGGTGTYLFKCEVVDGAPVLKASSYETPMAGLPFSTSVHVINKDGEIIPFSLYSNVDLYIDQFGSGDVPFYFYRSNGHDNWTLGAETDMLEAVIGDPFALKTYGGSKRFTVPSGFRYGFSIITEKLAHPYYFGDYITETNEYLSVWQYGRVENPIENVTFTVDKPTILNGDYQTFRARVDFKEEYVAQVSDMRLEFVLPYESEFIENSVLVGSSPSDYSVTVTSSMYGSKSIITVPVANLSQPVRLCATPYEEEGYTSSEAFVIYNMNGETYRRSIGNVSFYVSDASIYVTPVSTDSRISVYGIAAGGKAVKVYDGDVLIAETTCLANGSWRVECNLHQPVNPSVHPIHAMISTMDGMEIYTETVEVEYRLSAPQPDKVTMCFLNNENVFDFVNGTTTPSDYEVPNSGIFSTYFTFVARLKGTTATVHNLKFKILDTKGMIITKNGNYMPSRNEWVCYVSYPDVNKLPITVGFSYDYVWEGTLCHYENDFSDNTNGVTPNANPVIQLVDPSGFVYEGVPSNRLEGVTATCYYKDPETDEAVLWDAEQYEQQNPLITDENGYYRWDVPVGQWQVKYEKEGYETTYSDWLPVPPPQLDVNIGMVDKTGPTVVKAHAYLQAVELEFDKYMYPETLTTDNISVSVNGKAVSGTIELLNAEVDDPNAITTIRRAPGTGLTFASRIRFNADQPFNTDKVKLHVKKDVTTYAGVQMNADYEVVLPLEVEMQTIEADSDVVVPFMGERLLNVAVQPAAAGAGKVLSVRSMAPMIATTDAESYTLDSNGEAVITVHGELPGASLLLYSIEGYNLTASTLVNVTMEAETTVATPTASIASGSEVEKGTALFLFCSTPGSTIYYTLDGSSPQDNTAARLTYDGSPIIINSDVTIKAIAVAEGLQDSEVATFAYHVAKTGMKGDVNLDGTVNIADINLLIDYILRDHITSEMLERGDVNGDNTINIADINEVIQIILGSGTRAQVQVNTSDLLHISNLTLRPGETGTMHVTVDNAVHYSGLQCDIVLPDGLTLVNVSATGGSMVETGELSTATSRAVTYSMSQKTFVGEGHDVLTLTVRADAALASESQVVLTDVVLADVQGRAWYAQDCTAMVSNASGINDLNATGKQVASVRYYNVAGQEMATPEGLTIQVTTYTDGTRSATRLVK